MRKKKAYKNFACQMDANIFDKLSEYCALSHQSKTAVVELALRKYLEENFDKMRKLMGA